MPNGKCPDGSHLAEGSLWILMHINELAVENTANHIETYHVPHILYLDLFTHNTAERHP